MTAIHPSELGRRAGNKIRSEGGSAMDAALTEIDMRFGPYRGWFNYKQTVRARLRHGPADPINRATYRLIMLDVKFPATLSQAISCVELKFRADQLRIAKANWWNSAWSPRTNAGPLAELRLILRFIRRYHPHKWSWAYENITNPMFAALQAAE